MKGTKFISGMMKEKEVSLCLQQWIDQYQSEAYRYSVLLMGNREDAWDLLQETWIMVYQNISSLRNPDCFKSWFYQILTRNAWKMKKKQSREVPVEDIYDSFEPGKERSSEEQIVECERNLFLMKQIQRLRPKLKTVVILYYYNEFSVEEIAKITRSLSSTVKSRLFQARKQLKKVLEEEEETWR